MAEYRKGYKVDLHYRRAFRRFLNRQQLGRCVFQPLYPARSTGINRGENQ